MSMTPISHARTDGWSKRKMARAASARFSASDTTTRSPLSPSSPSAATPSSGPAIASRRTLKCCMSVRCISVFITPLLRRGSLSGK